jgi:hypothetical protein
MTTPPPLPSSLGLQHTWLSVVISRLSFSP